MSHALLRRNSSKQGLQNLMRLTAQRSIEDAEEVERERRRKARESLRRRNSGSTPEDSSPESEAPEERNTYDRELKPSSSPSLEEDEGFSDWTQRREKQRRQRLQELSQDGEEEEEEENVFMKNNVAKKAAHAALTLFSPVQRQDQEDADNIRMEAEWRNDYEEEVRRAKEREGMKKNKLLLSTKQETQRPNIEEAKKKELKVSYMSKVFLCQKPKHNSQKSGTAGQEVTSVMNQRSRSSRQSVESEEAKPFLEAEQRLERIRQSLQEKESQELEQIRHRQFEAEQELQELKRRREERRRAREEEERQREEEEKQHMAAEEEERRKMREDMERRRMEAAERMKSLSTSSAEGEEAFSPKVSTHKITERTNSLNRSLKKSNSFKKTQPPFLLTRIDDKMEQYTHAVEKTSQELRAVKASLTDLPNSPEAVSSKKNLFEAGEAWSPNKGATCRDTGSLKVGVASLITHWVKGPSEPSSKQSPCRPSDVRSGGVLQKKNMWEILGDPSGGTEPKAKVCSNCFISLPKQQLTMAVSLFMSELRSIVRVMLSTSLNSRMFCVLFCIFL
ncbi:non-muscle caldesmon isoform X1 [Poecilia formosa]|uniref:non-muscle caldesmon isoform X1 n=1 Tax=Poecilia formosa TaxID=48698 RepID=UPI0007B9E5EC|nr:PREDICTED: non-muscle caldesmon-like isoform X1 [Poecilia formosa]